MPVWPLVGTYGQTTSIMTYHHLSWTTHKIGLRRPWHAIIGLGQHTRSDIVVCGNAIIVIGQHICLDKIKCSNASSPLDNTHDKTMLGVLCHHRRWVGLTVGRRRAWHTITPLGQHTHSDDVGCGMLSSPLERTHYRMMSGVVCPHGLRTTHIDGRHRA